MAVVGGTNTADNGNPFDAPLPSEMKDATQQHQAVVAASENGNPFDAPLPSEIAASNAQARTDGAQIQPVTTATNPKLAAAESAKDMPEYVGAVGAAGAGLMAGSLVNEVTAPVLKHIAMEYGHPALEAINAAAKAHPIVAKLLQHALETGSTIALGKYMKLFGKS